MESVKATSQTSSQQGVTSSQTPSTQSSGASDFGAFLEGALTPDSANKVSEEDLFSALVQERIRKAKGEEALGKFQDALAEKSDAMRKPNGFVPMEDATKAALIKMREAGVLTDEETDSIYSQAFAAAQLDENKEALYDNLGGAKDTTIAVALLEQALLSARTAMEKIDSGAEKVTTRSVEEASSGKAFHTSSEPANGGSAGFMFKPVSDTTGRLVVLLPSKLAGLVTGVKLYDPAGKLIESGRYSGNGNGGRDHYRFKKPGGDYPDGVTVEVTLKTKEKVRYVIKDSAQRTEDINPSNDSSDQSTSGTIPNDSDTSSPDDSPTSL